MIPASDIEDLTEVDDRLSAAVRGTMPYQVAIWVEGDKKPRFSCTCPQGEDGKFCKHEAAVALTLQKSLKLGSPSFIGRTVWA